MLFEQMEPNERFRARREHARRRRRRRRAVAVGFLLAVTASLAAGAQVRDPATTAPRSQAAKASPAAAKPAAQPPVPVKTPRQLPDEVRGIHVTMALASLDGKLEEYLELVDDGLNTIELDVKDENGEIGFVTSAVPLAREVGAAQAVLQAPRGRRGSIHAKGVYLIGRVVVFEDPRLSAGRPELAVKNPDGSVWRNHAGLGWTNPYDRRVWDYNVSLAEVAARAGFDEIQFDYVRFPTDGDVESIVYPNKTSTPPGWVIAEFVHYAAKRLKPLGVRISTDVFGLSATRDLGIGQIPKRISKYVDAVYPMVYPSHYGAGEYGLEDPNALARPDGRVVALRLPARAEEEQGGADPVAAGLLLRPHLRARRREGADRGRAPDGRARVSALEPARDLHAGRARPRLAPFVTIAAMAIGDVMRTRVVTVDTDDSVRLGGPAHARGGRSARSRSATPGGSSASSRSAIVLALVGRRHRPRRRSGRRRDDAQSPFTVDADAAVLDAARLMGEKKIRHLPVVEGDVAPARDGRHPRRARQPGRAALADARHGRARDGPRSLQELRRQPLPLPDVAVALVADPVVQPVVAVLPELVRVRDDAVAAPVRRQRHVLRRGSGLRPRRRGARARRDR